MSSRRPQLQIFELALTPVFLQRLWGESRGITVPLVGFTEDVVFVAFSPAKTMVSERSCVARNSCWTRRNLCRIAPPVSGCVDVTAVCSACQFPSVSGKSVPAILQGMFPGD
ncbi:hypothetical protein CPB83DRAFT_847142 [Crepidotus variabilis]|uniref:Uncharacterized protein n=1 Tax=Crepidotus variabilis TaxID=179855 RepID=A0A9P6EP32_9AGAR|nr:hypothetical protein CPB83DRAFT_847142 [Crepidotus variabilis]